MADRPVTSWTETGDRDNKLADRLGEVRVTIEVILPGRNARGKRDGKVLNLRRVFTENDIVFLKSLVEISVDQMNTHVLRHWDRVVEPWLQEHSGDPVP